MPPPWDELYVEASVFEGLYQRSLKASGAFAQNLKAAGYDLAAAKPRYHPEVMSRCLEVAVKHFHPELPKEDAYHRLGLRFADGFRSTLVGTVIVAVFPLIGPERMLKRVPKNYSVGQNFGVVTVNELAPKLWRFSFRDNPPGLTMNPWFTAGSLEGFVALTKVDAKVAFESTVTDGFDLRVSW